MATDPRKFIIKDCGLDKTAQAASADKKKSFLDGLSNVGALEVLNDIGLSEVGEGLRVLTGVSDTIRLDGKIPTFLSNAATDANEVLKGCGIDLNAIPTILEFNPQVANRALGQAKAIADRIKAGNFTIKDIPKSVAEIQNLYELINKIYVPESVASTKLKELCGASPYARDLIAYAPKFKFLFFVQMIYNPSYNHLDEWGRKTAFVVKNSTRPNVEFEYEEVNMYNFWTKIPKRTIYQPMTMRFYDDNKNSANYFYNSYLRAMSPIANKGSFETHGISPELYQQNSIYREGQNYNASLGPLADNTPNILSAIRLYHIYGYGQWLNIYTFYNPKITNLELDDLDMTDSGAGSEMSFQFVYDGLHIESAVHTQTLGLTTLKDYTGDGVGAKYPITPVFESGDAGDAAAAAGGNGASPNIDRVATSFENMATDPGRSSSFLDNAIASTTSFVEDAVDSATSLAKSAADKIKVL